MHVPRIGRIHDEVLVVVGADDVLPMVADPDGGEDGAVALARGEVVGNDAGMAANDTENVFEELGDVDFEVVFADDDVIVVIDKGVDVLVDGEVLMHELKVLRLDADGDLLADLMVTGIAAKDLVLADFDDVFVMDALEDLGFDDAVGDAFARLQKDHVRVRARAWCRYRCWIRR